MIQCDVACLTPPGLTGGAVATLVVLGEKAESVMRCACGELAVSLELNRPRLVKLPLTSLGSETPCEEVVICRIAADNTPRFEIYCHGGIAVIAAVIRELENAGARHIQSDAWRDMALSLIADEAIQALSQCRTERAAQILLDQYHGALDNAIAASKYDGPLAWESLGRHLTEPWRVVLAGLPNAGKSSLMNALLGFDRVIVSGIAGTTRDAVVHEAVWDGWCVALHDTAGLSESESQIARAAYNVACESIANADLVIEIIDSTTQERSRKLEQLAPSRLVVVNKADLVCCAATNTLVSAKTGLGIESLIDMVVRRLVPHEPPRGAAVPFTQRQRDELHRLAATITR